MKIPPPQLPPFAVCFKSILSVPTETGNIWTHLTIGCLAFFFICLWFLTKPDTHIHFQMIAVTGLALAAIVVLLWDKLYGKLYRPLRAGIFSCRGLNVTEMLKTMMDLLRSRHRKLPAELDREIFLFLKPAAQRKFIWGLNWDFYAMFRHKLLTKTKRVCNPTGNRCNNTKTTATIAADGLNVRKEIGAPACVFAKQPFPISGAHCRVDEFPGTICYYYEVKANRDLYFVGLSDGAINNQWTGRYPNSYAIGTDLYYGCWLAGRPFELPEGARAIRPRMVRNNNNNIYGCGLVLDSEDKLWIFFTFNGKPLGGKISISPTVDRLFPTVTMFPNAYSFEANFGNNPAKPFLYDIKNCPGMDLPCF